MAWNKVYPLLTTNISGSVTQITTNFTAIESVMSAEHVSYLAALSGTHRYGQVSTMFSGTYAAILDLANPATSAAPATGALAYDTGCGVCRIYDGSAWPRVTATYFSRLHGYRSTSQSIASAAWTEVVLTTESYDSLAEFTASTGVTTIVAPGWYLVVGTITWPTETSLNYKKGVGIYIAGISACRDVKYGKEVRETEVYDIINITAGQGVKLYAYHSYGSSISIAGANLMLTRLS